MKILVLNCGSSSIKYKLYNMDDESVLSQGGVERIGIDNAFIKVTLPSGKKKVIMHDMPDHKEGVNWAIAWCRAVTSSTRVSSSTRVWKTVLKNCATSLPSTMPAT